MTAPIDTLLGRLDGVRETGADRWVAKCPSHDDKRASLSVRELDDGAVLVHDFAGCGVEDVLGAVGLEFRDLYPERTSYAAPTWRPWRVSDLVRSLRHELCVALTVLGDVAAGRPIEDRERVAAAIERINAFLKELENAR